MNQAEAVAELKRGMYAALETYSNVHRGIGHNSIVTTHLFEQARKIVLEYLGLSKIRHSVIFCSPRRAGMLKSKLPPGSYKCLSSQDIGLPFGLRAIAVMKNALPVGIPAESGGGTTLLISREWVMWAKGPDRFEAGTPPIINIIAFAKALKIMKQSGIKVFNDDAAIKPAKEILYHDDLDSYSGRELLDHLRKTLIGRDIIVPTAPGDRHFINLDNAASTRTFEPVWEAYCKAWSQPENIQRDIIKETREICSGFLGALQDSYDIIFTSNTTEAINLVAQITANNRGKDIEPVILNTLLEHSSNDLPWRNIPGYTLTRLGINNEGFIDLDELEKLLSAYNQEGLHGNKRIRLVAVSAASNVLGTVNNLEEISKTAHRYGAHILADGAQLVAHRGVDIDKYGLDYFAFSGHKAYAPFGSSVLAARKGLLSFTPSELSLINASGEENIAGIAALGKALVLLKRAGMDVIREEERELMLRALQGMSKVPGMKVYGVEGPESPGFEKRVGVISFTLNKMISSVIAKKLSNQGGIGIRSGCHCSHILVKHLLNVKPGLEKFQRVMLTLLPSVKLPGIARVSIGIENTEEEIDFLVEQLDRIARKKPAVRGTKFKSQMKDFIKNASTRVYSTNNFQ